MLGVEAAPALLVNLTNGQNSEWGARLKQIAESFGWDHAACDSTAQTTDTLHAALRPTRSTGKRTLVVLVAEVSTGDNDFFLPLVKCLGDTAALEEGTAQVSCRSACLA
eukprot:CAMPEP_0177779294 /NCGR_PEP_ID=MMETSP0491_2-20121128/16498_1 /TAXON_ID=63592 /ORGANISM="Tetraselmis chuii, Strain PLY429" /LENGTH=108 /DNA_ID=CAMNT_0019298799 /DNA_START=128 /DNA_END=450 /DNA_ORIENTATION=-